MDWPPYSPDMNIIEHVWNLLEKRLRCKIPHPKNTQQLWDSLEEAWWEIPSIQIRRLYESMPRRVKALHDAKGGHTKY
ncbi:hypothetical protein DL93DRAFT_2068795 [Clavulina sp. PMI_390]|nr:hypothetical protein DL93DRAFT_2068795 [Clavulina sp. PMI_390]